MQYSLTKITYTLKSYVSTYKVLHFIQKFTECFNSSKNFILSCTEIFSYFQFILTYKFSPAKVHKLL